MIRCIHAQDPTLSSIAGYQAKTFNDIFSKRQETPTEHLIAILDHLENWFRSQSRQSVFTRGDTPDPDRPDLAQITESGTPVPKKEVHPPTQTTASPEKPVKKTLAARRPPRSSVPSPPPRPDFFRHTSPPAVPAPDKPDTTGSRTELPLVSRTGGAITPSGSPAHALASFIAKKERAKFQPKPVIDTLTEDPAAPHTPFIRSTWEAFVKAVQTYSEKTTPQQSKMLEKLIISLMGELTHSPELEYNLGCYDLVHTLRKEAIHHFETSYRLEKTPRALFNIGIAHSQLPEKGKGYAALADYFRIVPPSDDEPGWFDLLHLAEIEDNYCLLLDLFTQYADTWQGSADEPPGLTIRLLLDTIAWIYAQRNNPRSGTLLQKISSDASSRELLGVLTAELPTLAETLAPDRARRKSCYDEYISIAPETPPSPPEKPRTAPKGYIFSFWGYPRPLQGIIEDNSGKRYFYRVMDVIDPSLFERLETFSSKDRIPVDFYVRPAPPEKLYEIAFDIRLHHKPGDPRITDPIADIVSPGVDTDGRTRTPASQGSLRTEWDEVPEEDRLFSDFSLFFLAKCKFGQIPPNKVRRFADGKGTFIGTTEEAATHINHLDSLAKSSGRGMKTPLARADDLLTAAKIAYDAELKTEKIYYYLYRSLNSWGDYYSSDENVSLEPALACYFETLYVFDLLGKSTHPGSEEPRYALVKYLSGILGRRLPLQQVQTQSIETILDEFFSGTDTDPDLRFDHLILLSRHSRLSKKVILTYILKHPAALAKTLGFINRRSGIRRESIPNIEELTQLWDSVQNSKSDPYKKLVRGFTELQVFTLSILNTEKAAELIGKNAHGLIFRIDQTRLHDIRKIFLSLKKSIEENSFEDRDNYIRQSSVDVKNLVSSITEFPTQFSVEKILPLLHHLQGVIDEDLFRLYETAAPQIKIRLRAEDESFVPHQGKVTVKITIENAKYCSPVESLELLVEPSPQDMYTPVLPAVKIQKSIHGGQAETRDIELFVAEKAMLARTFTLQIKGQYNSRTINNQSTTTTTPVVNLPIRLYSKDEFRKIANPYASWADSQAVKDSSMFFGRDDLIETIVTTISQTTQAKGFVIYGQRRSGKSSILYHICKKLKQDPDNLVVNIHSIGGALSEDSTRFGLLEKILWNILKELKNALERAGKKQHLPVVDFEFPAYEKFSNDPSPLMLFQETMDAVLAKIRQVPTGRKCRIIVLIDEFSYIYEWILEGKLPESIMKNFKSFLQKDYFKLVIAGQDIMPDFMHRFSNEFAVFQPERVTYLLPVYARQLIEDPLRIGGPAGNTRYLENSVEVILELTACNPYYIQIFCNRLVDLMNREYSIYATRVEVDKVKEELISGQNSLSLDKFENLYNSGDKTRGQRSTEDNLLVLYEIASHSEQGPCHISKIAGKTTKEIPAILDDLVTRDVLTREEDNYYRIKVGLFKDWLKKNYSPRTASLDRKANPFAHYGTSVSGEEFVGRAQHLEIIENRIINVTHPGNLAITGLPRIGKTSIVNEFLRVNEAFLTKNKRIPIYIDISQYHNTDDFFMGLVDGAVKKNAEIGIDAPGFSSVLEHLKRTRDSFERNNLITDFYAEYRALGYTVIYFLDEFDVLCQMQHDATILQMIRNLISSDKAVRMVTISRRTLAEIERIITQDTRAASTFAGVFQDTFVGEFTDEDMNEFYKKLKEHSVSLTESEKASIVEQCGTFPLYISGIGCHLIDQKNRNREISVPAAIDEIKSAMFQNFKHIADLLHESGGFDYLTTCLFTNGKIPQLKIHEFEQYGLIRRSGDSFRCSSRLFCDYVQENPGTGGTDPKTGDPEFIKILNTEEELPDVEFKTSALWSLKLTPEEIDTRIQEGELAGDHNSWYLETFRGDFSKFLIARSLAAFLNTDGGDLMIGVNEIRTPDGTRYNKRGIETDLQILGAIKGDNSIDSYRRFITKDIIEQFFDRKITNHFSKYFSISTKKVDNRWFCRITAIKSDQAIVLKYNRQDFFFVRKDTTIKQLNMTQMAEYIHNHEWAPQSPTRN
ncbi:MAG: RNA-binding domain-containing protein [Methanoregula sp.]